MTGEEKQRQKAWIVALASKLTHRWKGRRAQPLDPDPYLGSKSAGREIYRQVRGAFDIGDSRLHARSLLCALGAVAGCACQASVRAQSVAAGKGPDAPFRTIQGEDGKAYLSSDAMIRALAEERMSLWNLAVAAARHYGARSLPNLEEIFEYNASVLGTQRFGVPRLPPEHSVSGSPIEFATRLWPQVETLVRPTGDPKLWPIAAGLAVQEAIAATQEIVAPEIAVKIVMESAIPVSRIPIEVSSVTSSAAAPAP
jgi:hypothetical protein